MKKWVFSKLSLTGLVIGSMLPDVEYYLRMTMYGTWGMTWPGLLIYEPVLAILFSILFHLLIRNVLILHLPHKLSLQWADVLDFDWLAYLKFHYLNFFVSLFLGVFTHLFWDVLTHEPGYVFGISFSFLNMNIGHYPLHTYLQMILSIVGLGLLVFLLVNKKNETDRTIERKSNRQKLAFWTVFILVFFLIYMVRVINGVPEEKYIIQHMVICCSAAFLALICTSVWYKHIKNKFNM